MLNLHSVSRMSDLEIDVWYTAYISTNGMMYFIVLVDHPCNKKDRCEKNRKCISDGDSFGCPCKQGFMDIEEFCQGKEILVWAYSANLQKSNCVILSQNESNCVIEGAVFSNY